MELPDRSVESRHAGTRQESRSSNARIPDERENLNSGDIDRPFTPGYLPCAGIECAIRPHIRVCRDPFRRCP
jgi:hypothetical protein